MNLVDPELLYSALKDVGTLDQKKLDSALKASNESQTSFIDELVDSEVISDKNLGQIVADLLKVPFIHLEGVAIPEEVLKIIPEVVARKQSVIAFAHDKDGLKIALNDPSNGEVSAFLSKKTGETVKTYFATKRDIGKSLSRYRQDLQKSFDQLLKQKISEAQKNTADETLIIKIVDLLIDYAFENRSSDLHIEPEKDDVLVRFRVDGVLHDVLHLPFELKDQIVSRIKVASRLKTDEHLSAQDGKMQKSVEGEDLDIRVSVVPITRGEKVVMRLLSSKSRQYTLEDLGLKSRDMSKVKEGFEKPYGMILATGPTGSGKTTTIYAIVRVLNTREVNIATIEDPVEYDIAGINQIQTNEKTNLTFANGLRAILRQDPNVIFVGEIRDEETAGIAVNSATTGHLVLSTLHTNNAATTLPRLIDMGIEPYLVASTVNVIIAQRLMRKICEKCRVSMTLTDKDLLKGVPAVMVKRLLGDKTEFRAYQGKGCPVCHQTGYLGRVGAFEVMVLTSSIKELIIAKASEEEITKKAVEEGMTTMMEDGLEKVFQGITSLEEVLRVTKE